MGQAERLFTIVKSARWSIARAGRTRSSRRRQSAIHSCRLFLRRGSSMNYLSFGICFRRHELGRRPSEASQTPGRRVSVPSRHHRCRHSCLCKRGRYLALLPEHYQLEEYYREKVLPLKKQLDSEYMARATFASDFALLIDTVLGAGIRRSWRAFWLSRYSPRMLFRRLSRSRRKARL